MTEISQAEKHDKWWAAATSVAAGLFLTIFKAAIGISTGSLGILAEALHSLLDLAAALITFIAINVSSRPPDEDHQFGHGKVENFSALAETVLLLITCLWIFYEAYQRLFVHTVEVDANIWAFLICIVAIVVDLTRSRQLKRVADQYNSQALEADALHFQTDIWSSAVVLLGLGLVFVGQVTGMKGIFVKADAVAAVIVALIVVYVSIKLGKRTIDALLDRAPKGVADIVRERVSTVDGVRAVDQVRVRSSGAESYVDVTISVQRSSLFEEADAVSKAVESAVREVIPRADVVVRARPIIGDPESILREIRFIAVRRGLAVHHLTIQQVLDKFYVALELEVAEDLTLGRAHELASQLEATIKEEMPTVARISSHIEPRVLDVAPGHDITAQSPEIVEAVRQAAEKTGRVRDVHGTTVLGYDGRLNISLHCRMEAARTMRDVHDAAEIVQAAIRTAVPQADRILVHTEP